MKHVVIAALASLSLIAVASAQSSSTTVTTGSGAAATSGTTVVIQPEVRTKVRQYVTTSKPKAVTAPSGFTVRRGVALPETVEVQTFPADVGVTDYRYVVIGNQTVLVNRNREIIEIID